MTTDYPHIPKSLDTITPISAGMRGSVARAISPISGGRRGSPVIGAAIRP